MHKPKEQAKTSGSNKPGGPFFRPAVIQPKLTINEPGDAHEREADAVADSVVQRKCEGCLEEKESIQRVEQEGALTPVMRKPEPGGISAPPELAQELTANRGRGRSLPESELAAMNAAMGADFSNVRIHSGNKAASMSERIQARAFTHGSDIYFNAGEYNPGSSEGKRLLAHELTHVVQQGGTTQQLQREVGTESGTCSLEGMSFDQNGFINGKNQSQVLNGVPKKLYRPPGEPCTDNRESCDLDPGEMDYILEENTPVKLGPRGGYGDLFQSVCFKTPGKFTPEIYWVQYQYVSTTLEQQPQEHAQSAPAIVVTSSPKFEEFRGDPVEKVGKISAPAGLIADAKSTGLNIRAQPISSAAVITKIKYNEKVFIKAKNKSASQQTGAWVYVIAMDGRAGWIDQNYTATDMPDPKADLHHVTEPDLSTVLSNHYKGTNPQSADDLRLLSAAVLVANEGRAGLNVDWDKYKESLNENWFTNFVDPWNTVNRAVYQSVQIVEGLNIWLPSNDYIQHLKAQGIVTTRPAFVDAIKSFGEGYVGFQIGVLEGFFGSIWDALEGIWELGKAIIETIGKIITGEIINDIEALYDTLKNLTWAKVREMGNAILSGLGTWWEEIKQNWNSAGTFGKARMIGKVVGVIALEVLMAIFTGGAGNAAKWIAKLGKVAPRLVKVFKRAIAAADAVIPPKLKKYKSKDKDLNDSSDSATVERYKALAMAKAITETHDQKGTSIPMLLTSLSPLVRKYRAVKGYKAKETAPGHYKIIQRAEKKVVDPDYTVTVVSQRTRPTPGESERFAHQHLTTAVPAPDWETQVRFLNGNRINMGNIRRNSTMPDSYSASLNLAAEVKNYDLAFGYDKMIKVILDQHGGRIHSLPGGTRSWLFVELRGQNITDYATLGRRVRLDLGGNQIYDQMHFLTDTGVVVF